MTIAEKFDLTLETLSGPEWHDDGEWQAVKYKICLRHNGRPVHTTEYKLGTGHVSSKWQPFNMTREMEVMWHSWKDKPHAKFVDRELFGRVVVACAKRQKLTPDIDDVVYSLLSDGSAYFDHMTFADFADSYGYNSDSIKAKETYDICLDIGRDLVRALGADKVEELRDAYQDY